MKNLSLLLLLAMNLIACASDELTRREALHLLKEHYPKKIEDTIYLENKYEGGRLMDLGFEKQGLIYLDSMHKPGRRGYIRFTEKAEPYLLQSPDDYMVYGIMRVVIFDQIVKEITSISQNSDRNAATVYYTTRYQNPTPFTQLRDRDYSKEERHNAEFTYEDNQWVLRDINKS
ncbi:hypothetical protein FMM05_20315 [Flavobacterium zepuense]|uniref:Lipoprotein n=1 Tax=Flavobacterium zepuense TaxID=2593302 RepID=A0A552UTH6_9FLAO|nr:hypothetical protein [Flavobacterium zepuense]TRW21497.1 hypothetical protein FMM05_20315 [Flavobacterium zepuense]